jgi:hypothetical protein
MPANKPCWLKKTLGACLAFSFSTFAVSSLIYSPLVHAHAEHGTEGGIPTVSAKTKLPKGVSLQVVKSNAYQFALATDGKQKIEILGEDGRAFIRFDGDQLYANLNATGWHRSRQPGGGPLPDRLKTKIRLKPNWILLDRQAGYGWFDPRLMKEDLPRFNLSLRVNGKTMPVRIERIEPAPMTGYWRPVLTGESPFEGLNVMMPGLSGSSVMLSRPSAGDETFQVLDDSGKAFLELRSDGAWLDSRHEWATKLDLFYSMDTAGTAWVKVSETGTITYSDPRLARKPSSQAENGQWSLPVKSMPAGVVREIAGELRWQKIEAAR